MFYFLLLFNSNDNNVALLHPQVLRFTRLDQNNKVSRLVTAAKEFSENFGLFDGDKSSLTTLYY